MSEEDGKIDVNTSLFIRVGGVSTRMIHVQGCGTRIGRMTS